MLAYLELPGNGNGNDDVGVCRTFCCCCSCSSPPPLIERLFFSPFVLLGVVFSVSLKSQ